MDHNQITGDGLPQMGIPDHAWRQELDFPVEALPGLLDEPEIALGHRRGHGGIELGEKINIAVLTLFSSRGGPKHGKPTDSKAPAQNLRISPEFCINHFIQTNEEESIRNSIIVSIHRAVFPFTKTKTRNFP